MSGLLFLQTADFNLQNGTKGKIMCNNVRGISLILFYSTKCEHCQKLIPIFKRLPGHIGGCQFGMVNISLEKQIIGMSMQTIAPIKYVPLIILFVNGKPFIRYDGPHNEQEIKTFVLEVTNKLQTKEKFSSEKVKQGKNNEIPAYTIGHPLYGQDEVSYLEYDEAYTKKS
jgi:thiol-disulfide isomerase/thioredoxin